MDEHSLHNFSLPRYHIILSVYITTLQDVLCGVLNEYVLKSIELGEQVKNTSCVNFYVPLYLSCLAQQKHVFAVPYYYGMKI